MTIQNNQFILYLLEDYPMENKEKLINLIIENLEKSEASCEICTKMGFKCPVIIPENADASFKPDYSKCIFRQKVIAVLNQ